MPLEGTYLIDIMPVMVLIGVGAGLVFPSLMTLAMSGVEPSDSGLASGLVNTTVQVAGAIGLAVLATVATERTDTKLAEGASNASALLSGYHLAFLIGAVLVGLAVVAAAALTQSPALPQSEMAPASEDAAYSEAA